jgi:hypothetical protein
VVGRIYGGRHTPAEYRWFWSMTAFHVDPAFAIATNDRVPTLAGEGKVCEAWSRLHEATKQKNSSGSKLREWQVVPIRTGDSWVQAASVQAAEAEAAKQFGFRIFSASGFCRVSAFKHRETQIRGRLC